MVSSRSVRLGDAVLAFPSPELQPLVDSAHLLDSADWAVLRAALHTDGYLYLRGAIARPLVRAARDAVLQHFTALGGVLDPAQLPGSGVLLPRCGLGCIPFMEGRNDLTHAPAVLRVIEGSELHTIMDHLLDGEAESFDFKWLRGMAPSAFTGVHMDRVYMGRGSQRVLTSWVPFDDCTIELGALAVCEGSHAAPGFARLHATYGELDLERDGLQGTGWITTNPTDVAAMGGQWRVTDFQSGDVVIFGMRTLHMSTVNTTADTVRVSCDVRWQPRGDPRDGRYFGDARAVDPAQRVRSGAWQTDRVEETAHDAAGTMPTAPGVTMAELRRGWGV